MLDYFEKIRSKEPLDFVLRMAYLAEIREWDCRPHIERIRRYCLVIGDAMNIRQQDNELISTACQLHDIGKVLIPDYLLLKSGKYDDAERTMIERHTLDGAKILDDSPTPILQIAAKIALTHHERWDGSGYPNHLKGEEIPLGGRICAIADVFDALTTVRTYKSIVGMDEALKLIQESAYILFDPKLVNVFTDRFEEIKRSNIVWENKKRPAG